MKALESVQGVAAGAVPRETWHYLGPTVLADSDSLEVRRAAALLTGAARSGAVKAARLFAFVRDGISLEEEDRLPERGASAILKNASAGESGKATLLVALARAADIPARIVVRRPAARADCPMRGWSQRLFGGHDCEQVEAELWTDGRWRRFSFNTRASPINAETSGRYRDLIEYLWEKKHGADKTHAARVKKLAQLGAAA